MSRGELAYRMKRQGLSLSQIADELHIAERSVTQLINTQLKHEAELQTSEQRGYILAMENERLDYYLTKLWPSIEYGDVKAITTALAIHDRKMKANQLDKPDASTQQATVLVVGGAEADYVAMLKGMTNDG